MNQEGVTKVRIARPSDLEKIRACAASAYGIDVARIGKKPAPMVADFKAGIEARCIHVIETGGDVAGFIVLYPSGDHIHVDNVAVFPERQGQGLGKALLDFAESETARLNLNAIELYTNVMMSENLELYPKLGYTEIDRREEAGFSRVYYRKDL